MANVFQENGFVMERKNVLMVVTKTAKCVKYEWLFELTYIVFNSRRTYRTVLFRHFRYLELIKSLRYSFVVELNTLFMIF